MPWVHLEDVVGIARLAAEDAALSGPVNVVAPNSSMNSEFTRTLGRVLRRPTALPVPAVAFRLAFGELADVLLASQRVVPRAVERVGYTFRFPTLEAALRAALAPGSRVAA